MTDNRTKNEWGSLPTAAKLVSGVGFHLKVANATARTATKDPKFATRVRRNQLLDEIDQYHRQAVHHQRQANRLHTKATKKLQAAMNKADANQAVLVQAESTKLLQEADVYEMQAAEYRRQEEEGRAELAQINSAPIVDDPTVASDSWT